MPQKKGIRVYYDPSSQVKGKKSNKREISHTPSSIYGGGGEKKDQSNSFLPGQEGGQITTSLEKK